jgi:lysosomal acid lipase/cholesteryl ester hydrolase
MIRVEGYVAETHRVVTDDGYILTLHRIPYGKDQTAAGKAARPVVFLQHGLLCSSADWVMATPSKGLGYILADAGYDVWLGNYRGNTYSRNHTFLTPSDNIFWDFTWDEMAKYDIPAQITYVLATTGQPDLQYIGHSMGTTAFMAMHHYRLDIAAKVRLAHFLAPVATVGHMESPIAWIASLQGVLGWILDLLGLGEFLPSNGLMDCLASLFCHEGGLQGICSNILFVLCGFDEAQLNKTLLETIMHHTPAGASSRTILHYAQEVTSNGFHGFDWGSKADNFNHHHGDVPVYRLEDVTTPVALYWGDNDWLAAPEDILNTIMHLPNVLPGMNHEEGRAQMNFIEFFLRNISADFLIHWGWS